MRQPAYRFHNRITDDSSRSEQQHPISLIAKDCKSCALDYLLDMAAIDDHAGGIAKAHLAEYGLLDLDYPVIIPTEVEKRLGGKDVLDKISAVRLDIIPNPASDYIALDYRLESSPSERTFLRIIDNRGVIRQEQRLTSSEDQLLIQLSLESGSYRCDIIENGKSIVSKQLVISK